MRRLIVAAMLFLVACDGGKPTEVADASADAVRTTEQVEAERACGDLTGHQPDAAKADPTSELRRQEFLACVDTVMKGDAPALRGRTDAPA